MGRQLYSPAHWKTMALKIANTAVKEDLQKRLRRIEGQVRGVQKMLDEDRECHEIIQQLAAIRSAVHGASVLFMREYASDCLVNMDTDDKAARETLISDLLGLMGKAQ